MKIEKNRIPKKKYSYIKRLSVVVYSSSFCSFSFFEKDKSLFYPSLKFRSCSKIALQLCCKYFN